jgi:thiol-disulfide isomerase/thioredoxin
VIELLALLARLLLAGVFAVAGVAKLLDRDGTRSGVVAFGAPRRLAGPLALALPLAELAVAFALLPVGSAVLGAVGALALLTVFSGAIAFNLARGRTPDCHCFGRLHSEPAGAQTLVRNSALAGVALFAAVAGPGVGAVGWIGDLRGPELLAAVVGAGALVLVAGGAVAFRSLLGSYGQVLVRLERVEQALADAGLAAPVEAETPQLGLEPGTPAPALAAADVRGGTVTLDDLLGPGVPVLLLFTSPHCGPCQELLPDAARWQDELAERLTVAFVSDGTRDEVLSEAQEFGLRRVLHDPDHALAEAYRSSGTPSAVVVGADRTVASWVAPGREWIEALVASPVEEEVVGLPVGTPAPELELPTLEGERLALADLRGERTLLLFWNPECGFCRSLHEQLLAWESRPRAGAPRLLVVSSGEAEATRAESFRSTVVLDDSFAAGNAFGAGGTPMAVLLDEHGRIASPVAAGGEAVLALAGQDGTETRPRTRDVSNPRALPRG